MRPLLWITVALLIVLVLGSPIIYVTYSRGIPEMSTAEEVEIAVRSWAENERMQRFSGHQHGKVEKFELPPLAKMNRDYLALILADAGCTDFLVEPRESDFAFFRRVVLSAATGASGSGRANRCDLQFCEMLASNLGFGDGIRRGLATWRIHRALSREQLLRYRVAASYFGPGIVGADSAARRLLNMDLASMNLAETCELYLAEYDFELIQVCKVAAQIKKLRDQLLDMLQRSKTIPEDEIRRARSAPVACLRPS